VVVNDAERREFARSVARPLASSSLRFTSLRCTPQSPVSAEKMATSMEGKVCVVTGASSGIGEAIARALHAQGALVCVGARREDKLATLCSELAGAVYLATDVSKRAEMHALVAKAEEAFGKGVHLLVNVAGVMYFTCVLAHELKLLESIPSLTFQRAPSHPVDQDDEELPRRRVGADRRRQLQGSDEWIWCRAQGERRTTHTSQ
jgi:hypothetical protein